MTDTYSYLILGVYFLILLMIGYSVYRKETDTDFFIASRKVSSFSAGTSIVASWFDGPLLFTTVTFGFLYHWGLIWFYLGIVLGLGITALYAPKLRNLSELTGGYSFLDLIYQKIGPFSGHILSVVSLVAWLGLTALQFVVGGEILTSFTSFSYAQSTILMGIFIALYLLMGGFKASIHTDVLQVMLLVLVCVLLILFGEKIDPDFSIVKSAFEGDVKGQFWSVLLVMFAVFFAADGFPRLLAADSGKTARYGSIIAIVGFIILGAFFGYYGYLVSVIQPEMSGDDVPLYVFVTMMPDWAVIFSVVALFGLIMSSLDTYIIVAAQSLMNDGLMKMGLFQSESPKRMLRFSMIIIISLSVLMALTYTDIVDFFFYALMIIGCGAPCLFALMHDKTHNPYALGISCGLSFLIHIGMIATIDVTEQQSVLINLGNIALWYGLETFWKVENKTT